MRTVYIYGLWDCRDSRLRYIGKTVNLKARLHRHCADYDRGKITHCSTWIKGLLNEGLEPMMEVLEECTEDNWQDAERAWISKAKELGLSLVNMADGGSGGAIKGRVISQETKDKISKKLKGRIVTWAKPLTPEQKAKLMINRGSNKPRLGMKNTPEHNAKIGKANSIALKGKKQDKERAEKSRQASIKRWSREGEREKMSQKMKEIRRNKKGQFSPNDDNSN